MAEDYDIVDESEDDDILKDLFMESEPENEHTGFDPKEFTALKEALEEQKKINRGLLNTVKSDRRKRQEYKGRLDTLAETVDSILTRRNELEKQIGGDSDDDLIQIDVTEDGDAFLPKSKLNEIIEPFQAKINELEERLQLSNQQYDSERESDELRNSLIGEDERYGAVYPKYKSARKWINDRVIEFQRENNIRGQLTSGQALTHVFDDQLASEFQSKFPGMDLAAVTTAEDSEWHFKNMLKTTANSLFANREPDARFRQVMSKPSGLGKSANAKGGELSLSERVSAMTATDIMSLSDAQIEALNKYMQNDEQKEGINF